jgi:hypothetical protein
LIAAGDLIGTREAVERGIAYGLVGASVEQQSGDRVTAIALAGWQPFTDGNSRNLLRGPLIWSITRSTIATGTPGFRCGDESGRGRCQGSPRLARNA